MLRDTLIFTNKFILNSDFTIILPIIRVKTSVENVDWIIPNSKCPRIRKIFL